MIHFHRVTARATLALALLIFPLSGRAQSQSGGGWFVPGAPKTAQSAPPLRPAPQRPRPEPESQLGVVPGNEAMLPVEGDGQQAQLPPLQVPLPPMPEIPPIPKGPPTPAAIIGILSVPDVLRVSTAFQKGDKELSARRQRLAEDGRKEQNTLRELGQAFSNERARLTPEQIRAKEKEYTDRVNESRRRFGDRARIIQESAQYIMAQIERAVEQVTQQVALSRGVNLVLSRAQILGTTVDFDLTPQVADVLNRVLPGVVIPPDGVSPAKMGTVSAGPRASSAPEAVPVKKN